MGVLTDYFSAASDEAAASAIDLVGGPVTLPSGSSQPFSSGSIEVFVGRNR